MSRRIAARLVLVMALALAMVAMAAAPASAGPRIHCVANGHVEHAPSAGGGWDWTVSGRGPCFDDLRGPFFVAFTGVGHSDTLGLCDGLLVTGLDIDVQLIVANIRTGTVNTVDERWFAPVTTFPVATPFFIGGGQTGLGSIATRILLNCPPGGASVAAFAFTTST